jgi:CysZ protein
MIGEITKWPTELVRGVRTYWLGAQWLRKHPKQLFFILIPMVCGIALFLAEAGIFFSHGDAIVNWVLFNRPEQWWGIGLYYLAKALLYVSVIVIGLVACLLLMSIVASPIYEHVSLVVEADLTGRPAPELSIMQSIKLVGEELKKVLVILGISILLLLIPGLNVISTAVTAFLIGWDFFDYPLARRGLTFRERFRIARGEFWAVLGFGLWLVVPFLQFILMPLAVAGGTMLAVEALRKRSID